jgi:hypothetical protein
MAFSSFSVGIRPLLPSEFSVTASSGIYTHWQATLKHDLALDRPRSISRSSWWQTWVNPLPSIRSCLKNAPLLLRFSREIEKEQRSTFWQLLGLNAVQAALPAGQCASQSESRVLCVLMRDFVVRQLSSGSRASSSVSCAVVRSSVRTSD